jgi:hypothetical protein
MEEEAEKSRDARLEAWGRDDYSVYKPKTVTKPSEVAVEVQVETVREVIDGVVPFFREKPRDVALSEGEPLDLKCLVASEPRSAIHWLKNDLIFMDDSRLKVMTTEWGIYSYTRPSHAI